MKCYTGAVDHSFLLPLPKVSSSIAESEIVVQEQLDDWCRRLDRLSQHPSLWPEIMNELRGGGSWALIEQATTLGRDNLLHLAIKDDELDCVTLLRDRSKMLHRRNCLGITPSELARFLHKTKTLALLGGQQVSSFWTQPHISFEGRCDETEIEYLADPIFENIETLEEVFTQTKWARDREEISSSRIWMGIYYDREIQEHIAPQMAVRWTGGRLGFGLFTKERILPCSFVGEYTGVIHKWQRSQVVASNYCIRYTAWSMGRNIYFIDGKMMGNFTRFINHSDTPNLSLVCAYWRGLPRFILIAHREIGEGEQLTFDYGELFWKQTKIEKSDVLE